MLKQMSTSEDVIIRARNTWALSGHTLQMELMLKREISFVDRDISVAEYIEQSAIRGLYLSIWQEWKDYERDYYNFLRDEFRQVT